MQLSQLVTSLETSQKLKALWVEQESLFYWGKNGFTSYWQWTSYSDEFINYWERSSDIYRDFITTCSAFTSAELWEILPYNVCHFSKDGNMWLALHWHNLQEWHWEFADNEAEARWKLLIYLRENNLV